MRAGRVKRTRPRGHGLSLALAALAWMMNWLANPAFCRCLYYAGNGPGFFNYRRGFFAVVR